MNAPHPCTQPLDIFGETLPRTALGRVRSTTLKSLLRRRPDLVCTVTSEFDGMADGKEPVTRVVDAQWVIDNLLHSDARTVASDRLGAPILRTTDATYTLAISDGELARRAQMLANLPHTAAPFFDPTGITDSAGFDLGVGHLVRLRTEYLSDITDPFAFDEAIEEMRRLTAYDELYAIVGSRYAR